MVRRLMPTFFSLLSLGLCVWAWILMSQVRPGDEGYFIDLLAIGILSALVGIYFLVRDW